MRGGGLPHGDRRDAERAVIEMEDVGVEAEGLQECSVHDPILSSTGLLTILPVRSSLVHDHIARVPDNGLMTADAGPEPVTTGSRRLVPGEAEAGGYRTLVAADDDGAQVHQPAGP